MNEIISRGLAPLFAVVLTALAPSGAAQESSGPTSDVVAPEHVAYVFGYSGSFATIVLDGGVLRARWRLPEIAGLDRLLPEAPTGGLGQWRVYDPVYDARRNRLVLIAPTETTAFEELGHQLLGIYPGYFGVAARVDLGKPVGQPPDPPRLLHDNAGDGFVLLRPASASGRGVEVSVLDPSTLEVARRILLERTLAFGISGVAALRGDQLLLGGELFDLSASAAEDREKRGTSVDLLAGLDDDGRRELASWLGARVELQSEHLSAFLFAATPSRLLARIPRVRVEEGLPVALGQSVLLSHDLDEGATTATIALEHPAEKLVLSRDGRVAASLSPGSGSLSVFDLETGELRHQVEDPRFRDPLGRVLCTGSKGAAVVASSNQLVVWSPGGDAVTVLRGDHPADWIACVLAAH